MRIGAPAHADIRDGRAHGVTVNGEFHAAGAVAVAAGPWTPEALARSQSPPLKGTVPLSGGGVDVPISFSWGVVVELALPEPPRYVLEEDGIKALTTAAGVPEALFSAVTARGVSAVGSTFSDARPDPAALAPGLLAHAARFLPAVAGAQVTGMRACARPRSADGRPLLGPLAGIEGLAIASGHGAWGVTLGPASARLVADHLLGRAVEIPPALSASRWASRGCR